jgi:hypothetical protein
MSVCAYCVCVALCVCSGLAGGDPPLRSPTVITQPEPNKGLLSQSRTNEYNEEYRLLGWYAAWLL